MLEQVIVIDNQAPTITCPAPITVNADAGSCNATNVNLGTPITADNCAIATTTNNAPTIFPVGTTSFTITTTDVNGNTATCVQQVNVIDNQVPIITCPAPIIVNADPGFCVVDIVVLGIPITTDNCGIASIIDNAPTTFLLGTTIYTITVEDIHNNIATCTAQVTVIDNQAPTIICPATVNVNADAGSCTATNVNIGTPTTTDNCGVLSIINNAPSIFPTGTTIFTITVTDVNNITATCTQQVIVIDNQAPIITCPANVTINADAGSFTATNVNIGIPITSDNCGILSTVNNAPTIFPTGTTTFTITVTDINNNTATCTQH